MISRVRYVRSNMLTRDQVGVAGSHGLGTTDRTRSNMPTSYQDRLQDLTVSEQ